MSNTPEAAYHCRRCDLPRTEREVKHVALGSTTAPMCLACGGPVHKRASQRALSEEPQPLLPKLMSAVGYVLCLDGVIAAAALGAGSTMAAYFPIVGGVLASGMVLAYLFAIIQRTSQGDDGLPLPVDFISWSDLVVPFVRFVTALLVASAPAIVGFYLRRDSQSLGLQVVHALLCLATVAYVPAAVAQSALSSGWLGAINPLPGLSIVARIPRDYVVTVLVLAGLGSVAVVIAVAAELAMRPFAMLPLLPNLATNFVSVFTPMVMARALGVLLRERKHQLGL